MSSVSCIVLSLSLLTLIPLHAMEEKNNTSMQKGNGLKDSGPYTSFKTGKKEKTSEEIIAEENVKIAQENKKITEERSAFHGEATRLLLQETFHILKTGEVPEYIDALVKTKGRKAPKSIESIQKAQSAASKCIDSYFAAKNDTKRRDEILINGLKICQGKPTKHPHLLLNEFSSFIGIVNPQKFLTMNHKDVVSFHEEVLSSIQHTVARYCIKSLVETNVGLVETNVGLNKALLTVQSAADVYKKAADDYQKKAKGYKNNAAVHAKAAADMAVVANGYKNDAAVHEAAALANKKAADENLRAANDNKKASEEHLRKAELYGKICWIGIPSTAVVCTTVGAGTLYVLSKKEIININN
jgi:hypothetical protein